VPLKLERARSIAGWMSDMELEWLARQATRHYRIAEIGSWQGRSTTALAENTPGIVFAVDTWLGSEEHTPEQIGPEGWLFQQFSQNMRGLPVLPVMSTSAAAAEHFQRMGFRIFDMIFIDGAHDVQNVKADIAAWHRLLQPGGILCGHDFGNWPGLEEAVIESLGEVQLPAGSIWLRDFKEEGTYGGV
jgi:predicted O-methyltransferase YrrM